MTIGLTFQQRKLLGFISAYMEKHHGVAPSFKEMCVGSDVASKSGIHRILSRLEERGAIRRLHSRTRAIEIIADRPPLIGAETLEDILGEIAHLADDAVLTAAEVRGIAVRVITARLARNERRSDRGLPSGRAA